MNITELKPGDEKHGFMVWHVGKDGRSHVGKIKSWNDKYIFVVFNCDGKWDKWMEYTGEACKPEDLILYASDAIKEREKEIE